MGINIQRPAGVNVTVFNPEDIIYLKGDEFTDGSVRMIITPGEGNPRLELRTAGVFNDVGNFLTESLVLSNELDVTFNNNGEIVHPNPF